MKTPFYPTLVALCVTASYSHSVHAQHNRVVPTAFSCEINGQLPEFTAIQAIQGEGSRSPFIQSPPWVTNETHYVKGVVSAITSGLTPGFYLQAEQHDNNDQTSEGLFVYNKTPAAQLAVGDLVCVQGKIAEYHQNTQLNMEGEHYRVLASAQPVPVTPFTRHADETLQDALERHEGMHISLDKQSALFVTRNFSYDYSAKRNNMLLASQAPLYKPTQLFAANSDEAQRVAKHNAANRVYLESDHQAANGQIPYFPLFGQDLDQNGTAEQHIRLGARVEGLTAVVNYSYGDYRLIATNTVDKHNFIDKDTHHDVTRQDQPRLARADLRVASFNLLNYFTSATAGGNPNPTKSNRGAKSYDEFLLQQAKIRAAIQSMDADILGIMEIENNGFDSLSAIADLVSTLNQANPAPDKQYQYIQIDDTDKYQTHYFGSDAIMVGILYRPAKVTPMANAQVILTPEQHIDAGILTRADGNGGYESNPAYHKYQRHSLLQTFRLQQNGEPLTVVVNHFKSKGSECLEEWIAGVEHDEPEDLQGNCNQLRVSAAQAIGEALTKVEGDIVILGDLNAYAMEDPLLTLTDYHAEQNNYGRILSSAAYTTLGDSEPVVAASKIKQGYGYYNLNLALHGARTFSYSYAGELGNLDHMLANASLAKKVVDITDWHINAQESDLFEYSGKYTGQLPKYQDMYSSSDHDPVLIAIDLPDSQISLPALGETLGLAVRLPPNAALGDKLTLRLTKGSTQVSTQAALTQADLDNRAIQLSFAQPFSAGDYRLEERLTDAKGGLKHQEIRHVTLIAAPFTELSGGSTSLGVIATLVGLLAWRRRKTPVGHAS